jgi:hypothetical protein
MIRDAVMKTLIKNEPITPFTDRVRELAAKGVSTVLVIGGSGEYLNVADRVYMMDEFTMSDVTERAKELAASAPLTVSASFASSRVAVNPINVKTDIVTQSAQPAADWSTSRLMSASGFTSYPENSGTERLEVSDTGFIIIGDERIDMRALHDIATPAQTDALAFMLRYLMNGVGGEANELERMALLMRGLSGKLNESLIDIAELISGLYAKIEAEGFDIINTGFFSGMNRFLDMPRAFELRAVINRMRRIKLAATV